MDRGREGFAFLCSWQLGPLPGIYTFMKFFLALQWQDTVCPSTWSKLKG